MKSTFNSSDTVALTREELLKISLDLEQYHRVFDAFWNMSQVFFTTRANIRTAAVCFPPHQKPHMLLNRKFWDSLDNNGQLFVILHECLHVMLDHGLRNARHVTGATARKINIAQDITINEMIAGLFGFPRGLLLGWEKYCWIDTCFKNPETIEHNQVFEYYLRKLIEQGADPEVSTVDDHRGSGEDSGPVDDEANTADGSQEVENSDDGDPDDAAQELGTYLSADELEALLKRTGPEGGAGIKHSPFRTVLEKMVPPRLDFNTIVQRLKRSAKSKEQRADQSFTREDRRFNSLPRSLSLPGSIDRKPNNNKLITAVFFDVSGSCMQHINAFSAVKDAFEKETKLFEMRAYTFDTAIAPVDLSGDIRIGGGTAFHIIEAECQRIMMEDGRYPDCVVVITDGYGTAVHPAYPGRWVWLLTPDATTKFIHSASGAWAISKVTF